MLLIGITKLFDKGISLHRIVQFTDNPWNIDRLMVLSAQLLLTLAPCLIILATRPFAIGIWVQAEALMVGQWLLAGIGIILLAFWPRLVGLQGLFHPYAMIAFMLAGWSILVSPLIADPIRSWAGAPETGEGALAYGMIGVLAGLAASLRLVGGSLILPIIANIIVAAYCGLIFVFAEPYSPWSPYWFTDYIAFPALFAMVLFLFLHFIPYYWRLVAALLFFLTLIVISTNHGGVVLTVGLGVGGVLLLRFDGSSRLPSVLERYAPLMVLASVAFATIMIWILGRTDLVFGPNGLENLEVQKNSLQSRGRLLELGLVALFDDPFAFIFGYGWGSFDVLMGKHLILEDIKLFADTMLSKPTNWDAINRRHFNTHQTFLDATLSSGFIGGIAYLGLFLVPALYAPLRYRVAVSLFMAGAAGLQALWFQFPATFPTMALAAVLLCDHKAGIWDGMWRSQGVITLKPRFVQFLTVDWLYMRVWLMRMILCLVALLFFITAGMSYHRARAVEDLRRIINGDETARAEFLVQECKTLFPVRGWGGAHFSSVYQTLLNVIINHVAALQNQEAASYANQTSYADSSYVIRRELVLKKGASKRTDLIETDYALLAAFNCASKNWAQEGGQIRLGLISSAVRSELAYNLAVDRTRVPVAEMLADWPEMLLNLLDYMPKRSDLTIPYLRWLLTENREAEMAAFAEQLLVRKPTDAVGLWFSGLALLQDDRTMVEASRRMRLALDSGLKQLMEIEPEWEQQLRAFP